MHLLTAAEMREVDQKTVEAGIPSLVLMENAGNRVVEFLVEKFAPLNEHRIVVFCGKGNNGGDGFVVARQLFTRFRPRALDVLLLGKPDELRGDAAENYQMFVACGGRLTKKITPEIHAATLIIDALLGTGLEDAPRGPYAELIQHVNRGFPLAKIVAVDLPSGMASDRGTSAGEVIRADYTVTFTAMKIGMALDPNAALCGETRVGAIGSPARLVQSRTRLSEPGEFAEMFGPRPAMGHKGTFGHVLVVGGSTGKTGAAAMAGLAALRTGAGLVTVGGEPEAIPMIAAHAPELMTASLYTWEVFEETVKGKSVLAMGPGMGVSEGQTEFVRQVVNGFDKPIVLDADALTNVPGWENMPKKGNLILTPHPGEMARLTGRSTEEIQNDRMAAARDFATREGVVLVLKGRNTVIALPDGETWVNSTGGPSLGKGGTGDVLTGMIAAMVAQFGESLAKAVAAAVWLHGRAGDLAAAEMGDKCVLATDVLRYVPKAMEECARLYDGV
jgi:NAD(P)H-hydrate epimerase